MYNREETTGTNLVIWNLTIFFKAEIPAQEHPKFLKRYKNSSIGSCLKVISNHLILGLVGVGDP